MSWPPLEIQDNSVNVTTSLAIGHPPGSTFRVGYHVIKYDAQDSMGNKAYPCAFTVKVEGKKYLCLLFFKAIMVLYVQKTEPNA